MGHTINNLQEWLDKPIPSTPDGVKKWLDEIWAYTQQVGQIKAIAELAEADVINGDRPSSRNPIYMAAYSAAKSYHQEGNQ